MLQKESPNYPLDIVDCKANARFAMEMKIGKTYLATGMFKFVILDGPLHETTKQLIEEAFPVLSSSTDSSYRVIEIETNSEGCINNVNVLESIIREVIGTDVELCM